MNLYERRKGCIDGWVLFVNAGAQLALGCEDPRLRIIYLLIGTHQAPMLVVAAVFGDSTKQVHAEGGIVRGFSSVCGGLPSPDALDPTNPLQ